MKLLVYIALLLGVALLPTEATDVGQLIPVEVIAVSRNQETVTVQADTGDMGEGRTFEEAFYNMEDTASGVIYLDTAKFLLIEEGMEDQFPQLRPYLKGNVCVCYAQEGIPLDGIAEYLSVHKTNIRLDEASDQTEIPVISEENGRYRLTEK